MEDKRMFKTLLTAAVLTAAMLGASLSLVASVEAADAKLAALDGATLRKAVSGKTVILRISGFDLPIRYAANGTMKGSMSRREPFGRRRDRQRQMVDRKRSALPALDELDGRQDLLLPAERERHRRAVGAQRRTLRHGPHRGLTPGLAPRAQGLACQDLNVNAPRGTGTMPAHEGRALQ
jgi:hypothetical protein